MGQGEVIELLEKNGGWMTAREITKELGILIYRIESVRRALRVMYKNNEILRKEMTRKNHGAWYQWKIN